MQTQINRIRLVYGGAMAIALMMAFSGYMLLTSLHGQLESDGALINAAGRQRMLSQRLASLSLQIERRDAIAGDGASDILQRELVATLTEWTGTHADLVARGPDNALGHDSDLRGSLVGMTPLVDAIARKVQLLLGPESALDAPGAMARSAATAEILALTERYLPRMDSIVTRYEQALRDRGRTFDNAALLELGVTLLMLLATVFLVLEPSIRRNQQSRFELKRLRSMLDKHALYAVMDADGRIVDANELFCSTTGIAHDQVAGMPVTGIGDKRVQPAWGAAVAEAIRDGRSWRGETVLNAGCGRETWTDTTVIPFGSGARDSTQFVALSFDTTDRKAAEEAASNSLSHLNSVLAAATQVAIIATDTEGTIVSFNAGAERMLGYTAEELVGRESPAIIHLESEVVARCAELRAELGRPVEPFESFVAIAARDGHEERQWTYVRKDGTQLAVRLTTTATHDAHGVPNGYLGIAQDISTIIEQERQLEEQHRELRTILDAIPGYVYYKDAHNRILDCNLAAARSIGLPREEIIGHATEEFFPAADAAEYYEDDLAVLRSGAPKLGILENYDAGSGRLHLRTDKMPLRGPSGEFDRLVAHAADITDVVVANEEARVARERLEFALKSSNTGFWDWDIESGDTYFNDTWFTMLGYAPGELPRCLETWTSICHPDDAAATMADVECHLSGQSEQICNEHRLRCKDGSWKWVRDVGRIIEHNDKGEPSRVVGVHIDVQQLRDAITEAEISNSELTESKQRFELAIAGSRDAIFDWDLGEDRVYYSPRWRELLRRPDSVESHDIQYLLDHVSADERDTVATALNGFVAAGGDHFESEFRIQTDDERDVWVLLRAAAVRDADGVARRVSGSVADISALKHAEANLLSLVEKDRLTGLASRALLMERLRHALARSKRNGAICGLLFFDFDRFKVVNDSLGHDVGDQLLCSIAERFAAHTREIDTSARLGGDEFVLLLEDLPDSMTANDIAEKLLAVFREPHLIGTHKLVSTASIGLVTTEMVGDDPDALLRCADTAMYQAKAGGRDCVVCYDQNMHDAQLERLAIEQDLGNAAVFSQFALHYQPVVDLQSGLIVSAEGLLRWEHPRKGFISPGVFIPIAEECGRIGAIGSWVIASACEQLAEWRRSGAIADRFALSVNVSKAQLLTPGFVQELIGAIDGAALPREVLKIEVTETTVVDNRAGIAEVLNDIRDHGITVMMDDFGTGHSSLSGLHMLPVDELKIDQSFVRPADSKKDLTAIISSIISLAEHLQLRTIGEGVESRRHVELLRDMGCTCGQGYYWSKPVAAAEFEALLASWHGEVFQVRDAS